ncbi:atlastin-like isoform X2 [Clavelina lepadiformis]|uniref:atlastin-like isoform X2 n=1 Tax=Clavelina lepadiformis TaxID=159417 RepID=UPI00404201E0
MADQVINLVNDAKGENGQTTIDIDALEQVFLGEHAIDNRVAIYSITGPFGSGKSFFLNLFHHYLHDHGLCQTPGHNHELLDRNSLQNVFQTGDGEVASCTKGIYVSKEPHLLEDGEGHQIALFLMDTQGMFDFEDSTSHSSLIVGYSLILSSLQFFNVPGKIDKSHIEFLCGFSEFAQSLQAESGGPPYQHLDFLIRDYEKDTYPLGINGGQKYIEDILDNSNERSKEFKALQNYLTKFNNKVTGFILPPPGLPVKKYKGNHDPCNVGEIEDIFMEKTTELFQHFCSPNNIMTKQIEGEVVNGRMINDFASKIAEKIKDGEVQLAKGYVEGVHHMKMLDLALQLENYYWKEMCSHVKRHQLKNKKQQEISENNFDKEHKDLAEKVLVDYDETAKPGDEEFQQEWRNNVKDVLQQLYEMLKEKISAENEFMKIFAEFSKQLQKGVQLKGNEALKKAGKTAMKKALENIETSKKIPPWCKRELQEKLNEQVQWLCKYVKTKNKTNRIIFGLALGTLLTGAVAAGIGAVAVGVAGTANAAFAGPTLITVVAASNENLSENMKKLYSSIKHVFAKDVGYNLFDDMLDLEPAADDGGSETAFSVSLNIGGNRILFSPTQ